MTRQGIRCPRRRPYGRLAGVLVAALAGLTGCAAWDDFSWRKMNFEVFRDPEAELSVVAGRTKLIETRRVLTRIAIADPTVADIELLADQPNSRL